jgi:isoleucyl-tRNA synthetase
MSDSKDDKNPYKDTLNLPSTRFDMKANLVTKEPALQQRWAKDDLYGQIRKHRDGSPRYVLHDGPPYANGNIHIGHALNKVLKDIVIRIRNMTGFDAPYVPGWDCHGLPIEQKVLDDLGSAGRRMTPMEIRQRCQAYAEKFVGLQSQQFQRLGVLGQWDKPYITMNPQYESDVLSVLAALIDQGLVYKQLKPVHWSIANRTALADAELEYQDRDDLSIYVAFRLAAGAERLPGADGGEAYLVVWTTTPWTLPANLAVAAGAGFQYAVVRVTVGGATRTYVLAAERLAAMEKAWGTDATVQMLGTLSGGDMAQAGLKYHHPLVEGKVCPVVTAEYVTLEDGTGLVHTAPGHGLEDYATGLKHGLEIYCPVGPDGTFDETAPQWLTGVNVWKANEKIVDFLRQAGTLVASQSIRHSYPHDWRSKTPTIFRATEQWFIAVDRPLGSGGQTLRGMALDFCRRDADKGGVGFVPAWGRNRIGGMLESRPDWCISRQRAWGLPIPAFYNAAGKYLMTANSVRAVADAFARHGSDAWFTLSPRELLATYNPQDDPQLDDPSLMALDELTKGNDILDVWFESGSSWYAVALRRELCEDVPVDMYLEGSDQHRGWFQLSLLPALGARGLPPFRTVLTHGFTVDENGEKMSKSRGNVVDPMKELQTRGADILRLWIASQDYQDDMRCGPNLLKQAEDAYRKIRNTLRFLMGVCHDFDPAVSATDPADHSLDRWMLMQLHVLVRNVRQAYDRYEFYKATRLIYEFCTVEASSVYLAAVKDRLYCESPNADRRRATQTVAHQVLLTLTKLLAPILVHTCEEAWEHIPNRPADEPASVHLAALPEVDGAFVALAEDLTPVTPDQMTAEPDRVEAGPAWIWTWLMELRQEGLLKLEALRNAGVKNPLDAEVVFTVANSASALAAMLDIYLHEMEDLLGVGYARMERADLPADKPVKVEVFDTRDKYASCARSWKRRPDVGSDAEFPDLSARDAVVMKELRQRP